MSAKNPLLPYDRARKHLIETDWRALAEWSRVIPAETKADFASIELWSKNGRTLLLMSQRDGGFEVFYPTPEMMTGGCLMEIDQYADDGSMPKSPPFVEMPLSRAPLDMSAEHPS